jgi:hypothetical protein
MHKEFIKLFLNNQIQLKLQKMEKESIYCVLKKFLKGEILYYLMEKREAAVYLYIGILIFGALLTVYLFNFQLTGFVVYQQQQSDFSLGEKNNVEYNGTHLVLTANQTFGNYTSQAFDSNNDSSVWNNLTWQGIGNLTFEIRVCSSSDCSNATFASADLNNINISGRYFQYLALLYNNDSNSTVYLINVTPYYSLSDSSVPSLPSISLSEPSGKKSSGTNLPITFSITGGAGYTCWYKVHDSSDGAEIIGNTSLAACNTTTFDLGASDGGYIFTLYVNSSSGFQGKTSSFSVATASNNAPNEEPAAEDTVVESTVQVPIQPQRKDLTLQAIETSTINPSDSKNYNLIVTNTGDVPVSACVLSVGGNSASWASVPDATQNLNAGEAKSFAFSISVPDNAAEGNYALAVSVQCAETIKSSDFAVSVVKKRVEFNITEVERTRQSRVVVTYSLEELLNEAQTVQLQFFLYDANNQQVANVSVNQSLSAGQNGKFSTNIPINASLGSNITLTLSANINAENYSTSVNKPITLITPTGFFALGDNLGTTGNIVAIAVLVVAVAAVTFFLRRRKSSKTQ